MALTLALSLTLWLEETRKWIPRTSSPTCTKQARKHSSRILRPSLSLSLCLRARGISRRSIRYTRSGECRSSPTTAHLALHARSLADHVWVRHHLAEHGGLEHFAGGGAEGAEGGVGLDHHVDHLGVVEGFVHDLRGGGVGEHVCYLVFVWWGTHLMSY